MIEQSGLELPLGSHKTAPSKSQLLADQTENEQLYEAEYMPRASQIFVDKIACTVAIPDDERKNQINITLQKLVNDGWALPARGLRAYSRNVRLAIDPDNQRSLLMSYGPKSPGHRSLRLEWNPSNAVAHHVWQSLSLVLRQSDCLLTNTNVTRLDLAVDIIGADMESLVVNASKYARSKAFFNKGLQSYYLGGSESPRQIKVYDKRAEQRAKLKGASFSETMNKPLVRVEVKHAALDHSILDLIDLPNPFLPITIALFKTLERGATVEELIFTDSIRYRGAVDAVARLPTRQRSRFRQFIRDHNEPWWEPAKLWDIWPSPLECFTPLLMAGDSVMNTYVKES